MKTVVVSYSKDSGREKVLIPLEEYNKVIVESCYKGKQTSCNGIECPNCKNELFDDIHCIECGWKGRRYC